MGMEVAGIVDVMEVTIWKGESWWGEIEEESYWVFAHKVEEHGNY
jgi:hypothetical protein